MMTRVSTSENTSDLKGLLTVPAVMLMLNKLLTFQPAPVNCILIRLALVSGEATALLTDMFTTGAQAEPEKAHKLPLVK